MSFRMLPLLALAVLALSALPALGECASVKVLWDAPAACSPVACPPVSYTIYRSQAGVAQTKLGSVVAPLQTYTDTVPVRGQNCYVATATNAVGEESVASNEACSFLPGAPMPPLNTKTALSATTTVIVKAPLRPTRTHAKH